MKIENYKPETFFSASQPVLIRDAKKKFFIFTRTVKGICFSICQKGFFLLMKI